MVEPSQILDSSVSDKTGNLGVYTVRYPESTDLRLTTFSYLTGCDLFHKIAVTCFSMRESLANSGLLDQIKVITIKAPTDNYPNIPPLDSFRYVDSFRYALNLADSIQIQVNAYNVKYAESAYNMIRLAWGWVPRSKNIQLDLIVSL